ncbi:MAG: hypothetical protein ACR2P0_01470 [Acidimicrobiales bacterium]
MESTHELDEIRKAQLAPYEASATDPLWIWPLIGVLAFAQFAAWEIEPIAIPIAMLVLYCLGLGALVGFMTKRRGVQPTMRINEMPAPLRRELFIFWALSTLGSGAVVLVAMTTNFVFAGLVAGVGIATLGAWYHRRYRDRVGELVAEL